MRSTNSLALAAFAIALSFSTAADAQQPAVVEFNRDLQQIWDDVRPALQRMIFAQVQTQLAALNQTVGPAEISIRNLQQVGFQIQVAPGLTELGYDRVGLRVPRTGAWGFEIQAEVRVKLNLWFWRPTIDIPVTIKIEDLVLEVLAQFDQSDPTRPTLAQINRPSVDFRLKLRSRSWGWNLLFSILSPVGNYFAHKLVNDALDDMLPTLAAMSGFPGPVPGDGAPAYTDSGQAMPFAEIAANVDRKIRDVHTPHGMILLTQQDTDDYTSWEQAYRNGGSGNAGNVTGYHSGGDAAIWTGHYLASQAFRYAATNGDPAALDTVKRALAGIGALLDVNGSTGLLARNAAPETSQVGQTIVSRGVFRRNQINGQTWVGRQGGNGISRDQYIGVWFGLAVTYDLVNDPQVKAECAGRVQMMLDYFIAHHWSIDEDRPSLDTGSRGPTFYLGIPNQKLAYLLLGQRMVPGGVAAYQAEFNQTAPLVDFAWLAAWTSTFGFDHYYKYNLGHAANYLYFENETDPTRWQTMERAYRIMERYVGHHRNAHFDLIQTNIDPSTQAALFPATRESMRRFLRRHHREVAPAVVDLSNVTWQTFSFAAYSNPSGGGLATAGTTTTQVPSAPLDFDQRKYTGNFHWQRDPFTPAIPSSGNPRAEKHGLDVVLPYWMGRHFGAF